MTNNGKSTLTFLIIFLICICLASLPDKSLAGNSWMMEKNRDELLMLNVKLLEQLGALNENGEILLSGKVVLRNGRMVVQLDSLKQYSTSDKGNLSASENVVEPQKNYKAFLREESLDEIPILQDSVE